jgi:CDP-paratose 2-epimerase
MERLVITGAAGFIGMNLAMHLKDRYQLILIDDFSRLGSRRNETQLKKHGLNIFEVDIAEEGSLKVILDAQGPLDGLVHLAAQTSLLESIKDPKRDFDSNALGTLNLLEYLRKNYLSCKAIFLASNKLYGNLSDLNYVETKTRFQLEGFPLGLDESFPIVPEGGYSISKSISDSYVQEYGKRFSMPVVSLRQSAVYGPNQNSRSDQGWVSFFTESYIAKTPVALRGVGKQVRDILYIDDFSSLIEILLDTRLPFGEVYNVGGGNDFSLSILELFTILEGLGKEKLNFSTGKMSPEDQRYYVSNNGKISALTKWHPKVNPLQGVTKLYNSIYSGL